jgi:putative peptidoglycan lipid II flippase
VTGPGDPPTSDEPDWADPVDEPDWADPVDEPDWADPVDEPDWADPVDEPDWADPVGDGPDTDELDGVVPDNGEPGGDEAEPDGSNAVESVEGEPDESERDGGEPDEGEPATRVSVATRTGTGEGTGVRRATAVMAVGTTLSRATGVLRLFALAYALGALKLADSYNLANTMPNIVQDIVLGGILSATFVPVFVQRLTTRADDEAWDAVSAVVSVTMIVIAAASILFLVAVPFIVDVTTSLNHGAGAAQSRGVAKDLLFLFVPQVTCYGFISVGTALLNARRRFGAPMFTPIANNVVLIAVLLVFGTTVRHASLAGVAAHRGQILLLGLGTTAGVVVQAGLMVPSLRRAGLRLHWRPDFRHEAVRTIIRLSGWTFGLVAGNQIALLVVLALSEKVGAGAVSAYTYAYTFFQLPYGIVAVSIMSATAPELTAHWATGNIVAFRRRMGTGLRAMLAIIIPAAAGEVVLARPLVALVFSHGAAGGHTETTAVALAMLALGLPGFCVFLYAVRVLQSVQDLRSAFWLYALENAVNIVLAVALAGHFGVRGIALSISVAYTVAALVALGYVRTRVQGLGGDLLGRPLGHVVVSTGALVVAAVLGSSVSGSETTLGLLGRVALGTFAGGVAYVLAAGGLAELAVRRRHRATGGGTTPPERPGGPPERHRGPPAPRTADDGGRGDPRGQRRRRPGTPPRPTPHAPAGRPPLRPGRLGPTRSPEPGGAPHDDAGL